MAVRTSPEDYLRDQNVVDDGGETTAPAVNHYYASTPQSLSTQEEELAQIKFLIIGLLVGLALGIAVYGMMRDTRCR